MNDYLSGLIKHHWREDRLTGRTNNTYTKRTRLSSAEVEAARFDDYEQGFAAGLSFSSDIELSKKKYAKQHHGEMVDLGAFELGFNRGRARVTAGTSPI